MESIEVSPKENEEAPKGKANINLIISWALVPLGTPMEIELRRSPMLRAKRTRRHQGLCQMTCSTVRTGLPPISSVSSRQSGLP